MSETNQGQLKKTLLIAMILLLVLFAGIQTWYIVEMQKQLDTIRNQQSATQLQLQEKEQKQQQHTAAITKPTVATLHAATATATATPVPANSQQTSLQQKAVATPLQNTNNNVTADNTAALLHNNDSTTPLDIHSWNPYRAPQRKQADINERVNHRPEHYNKRPDFQYHFSQSLSTPKIDVQENDNQYTVFVNLPGAEENDISVTLNGQRLTIKSKQEYKKQSSNASGNIVFQEQRSGRFQRSITLAKPVNQNAMKPHLENGVLMVIIPKVKYGQRR